ncbi:MAG: NTP transferase domain-containing protein [Rubricoccaceae bacterium]
MHVPLILLAAGRSTRFGTLKQVAPVGPGGASILAYTVVDALLAGFSEVVLVVRPEIEATIQEHLSRQLGGRLPIRVVHQLDPLGTAHATLLGLAGIDGPAAVANGDDAYGRDALQKLYRSAKWTARSPDELARCALVAYPILSTLSEHGGVSRGWVQTDGDTVTSIDEIYEVRSTDDPARLSGRTTDGAPCFLPHDALGSMNLWMLGPGLTALLEREFDRYHLEASGDEFLLSTVLDHLRASNELAIRLAGTADGWFGLTFANDLPAASARLAEAHRSGLYAEPLAAMADPFRT